MCFLSLYIYDSERDIEYHVRARKVEDRASPSIYSALIREYIGEMIMSWSI